jgi:hypothetical protein
MKTKLQIIGIALTGFILASCSSSLYMSKSSTVTTDDIYYTPSKTSNLTSNNNSEVASTSLDNSQTSPSKFADLEKKYANANNSDTLTASDTLVAKDEITNPYERILSNSYQESYERRLRGMEDPRYGMENFSTYYSNDYFYASAYDPALYSVVVMGDQVWVEPRYISSMFLWPHNHYSNFWLGFGLGAGFGWNTWGWNSWYDNYAYSPYYWNNWYGYNPYPNDYWNNNNDFHNQYYGRRTGSSTNITSPNRLSGISYENQIVSSRRRSGTTIETGINPRTRNSNQTDIISRTGQSNNNQEIISRDNRSGNLNTTRLRSEATTRNINVTEPTRRNSYNFQTPRSTSNNDYIRTATRNQTVNGSTTSRDNTTRGTSTTRENRTTAPTYNRPSRVDSSTGGRSTNSGNAVRESSGTRSSARESSGSSSSSQSGSSSNSGSQNNGSSSTSRRR